ncbi:MAG TPA: hypothetical protein VLK58_14565 [Conexibacter sp.]|nr:hypothetical protein [Conexibacter sp.]
MPDRADVTYAHVSVERAIARDVEHPQHGWFDGWLRANGQTWISVLCAVAFLAAAFLIALFVHGTGAVELGSGFDTFAAFYIVAQAIERLLELLALSPIPPNPDPDAVTEEEKKSAEQRVTAQKTLVAAALSVLLAAGASLAFGLYFLEAVGITEPERWIDVLVTALLLSGGTKALHELIGRVTAAKEVAKASV